MSEYSGATDSTHQIDLPSAIVSARWAWQEAAAGKEVPLEIRTLFVGNGAAVTIQVADGQGSQLDSVSGEVVDNQCFATYEIPADLTGTIHFTVELSAHGLQQRSDDLTVRPPRAIRNPRWSVAEARRGDILTLTAETPGFRDGTRARLEIYEHDADGAHDLITRLTGHLANEALSVQWAYEYHEDVDEIPTEEESERGYNPPEYFFRVTIGPAHADSGLLAFKDYVEIDLRDSAGAGVADARYILHLPDGSTREGTLDAEGGAREEDVPPGRVEIEFPEDDQ